MLFYVTIWFIKFIYYLRYHKSYLAASLITSFNISLPKAIKNSIIKIVHFEELNVKQSTQNAERLAKY